MSQNITKEQKKQGEINPAVPGQVGLTYKPFDFREKRYRNAAIARAADLAGFPKKGDNYAACGTGLGFGLNETGRHLTAANFCHQRFCPICSARLARKNSKQLARILATAQERLPGCQFLFLTLAPRSVPADQLKNGVALTLKAWNRFTQITRLKRAAVGTFRALEVTRNIQTDTYHPHIHAILCVAGDYFHDESKYIQQVELISMWRRALRVSYNPTAHISAIYAKGGSGDVQRQTADAVREAAKYSVKDEDIIASWLTPEQQGEVFRTLLQALHGRRLNAFSGLLRDIARDLKMENLEAADLIDADENPDAVKIAYQLFEVWQWSDRLREYECTDVYAAEAGGMPC